MTNPTDPLLAALAPLVARVRTDVTARKGESGRQAWTREPLTPERLARHLNGGPARGVSQIKAGESVTMVGVLDLDSHGGEVSWGEMVRVARDVMLSLELLGGAPVAWRSSGGRGVHLYCLWDQGQDAYSVRQWLGAALESCGLRSGAGGLGKGQVEVFPKQDSVPADGFGNQVVLPLAGESVPLIWCDLADTLVPGTREDALGVVWGVSDPVPRLERPARAGAGQRVDVSEHSLTGLLDAIPNGRDGVGELDYDSWLGLVFAIHHETGGSGEGLALAHELSARSGKYDAAFLDERIWPYVHSDGRGAVRGLYLILMLLPFQVTMVPAYLTINHLGLMDTVWAVILPGAFSTFPVFVMQRGFDAVPLPLLEAAAIDGATPWQQFARIGLPVGLPGILAALTMSFLDAWNALEQPMTFLKTQSLWSLSLYLTDTTRDLALTMAASLFALLPAVLIFAFGQKYLEQGILAGAVKG